MNKIEEIDRLAALRRSEIGELAEKAEALPEKIEAADARASAAALEGDYDAYKIAARERDDLKSEAEFIRIRLEKLRKLPDVDFETVREAWDDFCKTFNPKMEQKIAEYQKTMRKAFELYAEMVAMQTEAATIRGRFASITGVPLAESCRRFPAKSIPLRTTADGGFGLLAMGGTNIKDPDAVRFLSDYIYRNWQQNSAYNWINDPELNKLNGVIGAGLLPR